MAAGLQSEKRRAGPGCGLASEIESRENEGCEWAVPSQKSISYLGQTRPIGTVYLLNEGTSKASERQGKLDR